MAARAAGVPAINNVTGLGTVFLHQHIKAKIGQNLYRLAFNKPHTVFFQNPDDRALFLQKRLVRPKFTALLPGSGVNPAQFAPQAEPQRPPFVFLMVARALYDKGLLEFIEAGKILTEKKLNFELRLLGAVETEAALGVAEPQLRQWEQELPFKYLGTTADVRPQLAQAHAVVLPSYREGTPRSLLEAGSMSKPIITTDAPGCREVVQNGLNGYLCEVKNASDLADKMEQFYHLPLAQFTSMGIESRKLIEEKFHERLIFQAYDAALAHL